MKGQALNQLTSKIMTAVDRFRAWLEALYICWRMGVPYSRYRSRAQSLTIRAETGDYTAEPLDREDKPVIRKVGESWRVIVPVTPEHAPDGRALSPDELTVEAPSFEKALAYSRQVVADKLGRRRQPEYQRVSLTECRRRERAAARMKAAA
jgi:hypothetical protein